MAKSRYGAVTLGLIVVLMISWSLGLGGFMPAPLLMADNTAPSQPGPAIDQPPPTTTTTPVPISRGVVTSELHAGIGYLAYLPTSATPDRPTTVLVTMGGMGSKAEDFATSFAPQAEAHGWLLIVPRFKYGDWKQIETVKAEDRANLAWLNSLLESLPTRVPVPLKPKILIYGFSRGAQGAHRFALMYPDRVLAVASMSAGTYTLPSARTTADTRAPLAFPLGVADLERYCGEPFDPVEVKQVAFWIGVGEQDNSPADVPQSWDQYIGNTRVERAKAFAKAMTGLGAQVQLAIIPDLGHGETNQSRGEALTFLAKQDALAAMPTADSGTPMP